MLCALLLYPKLATAQLELRRHSFRIIYLSCRNALLCFNFPILQVELCETLLASTFLARWAGRKRAPAALRRTRRRSFPPAAPPRSYRSSSGCRPPRSAAAGRGRGGRPPVGQGCPRGAAAPPAPSRCRPSKWSWTAPLAAQQEDPLCVGQPLPV